MERTRKLNLSLFLKIAVLSRKFKDIFKTEIILYPKRERLFYVQFYYTALLYVYNKETVETIFICASIRASTNLYDLYDLYYYMIYE